MMQFKERYSLPNEEIKPHKGKKKKRRKNKQPQLPDDMYTTYEPCVHLHFKQEPIDRTCLTHEQYLDMLATPRGYPWMGEVDCDNPELDINKKKKKKKPKRREPVPVVVKPDAGDFADEFVEDMWDVMSPEITDRLIDFLVNEFGMSVQEAEDFIDCKSIAGKQTVCRKKKSTAMLGFGPKHKWVKEFSDVFAKRIEQYIVSMLLTRRTPRSKRIAERILVYLCDLTGEKTTLQNPKTKVQRTMVLISDRLALWVEDLMKDIDKPKARATITEEEIPESEAEEDEEEGGGEGEGEKPKEETKRKEPEEKKGPEKKKEPEEKKKPEDKEKPKKESEEEKPKDEDETEPEEKPEEETEKEEEKRVSEEKPAEKPAKEPEEQQEQEPEPEPEPEPEKEPAKPKSKEPSAEEEEQPTEPAKEEPEEVPEEEKKESVEDKEEAGKEEEAEKEEGEKEEEEKEGEKEEGEKVEEGEKEEKEEEEKEEETAEGEEAVKKEESKEEEEEEEKQPSKEKVPTKEVSEEKSVEEPEKIPDIFRIIKEDIEGVPKDKKTDRQKEIKYVVDRRIESLIGREDIQLEPEDVDDAASRVAHWVEQIIGATERKKEALRPKGPSAGEAFQVRPKTGSTLEVQKLSSGTVAEATALARGLEPPPRGRKIPASVSPMNIKSAQEWVEWASNIATVADEWGKWLDTKLTDAEKQLLEKQKGTQETNWKQWRDQSQNEALKWRVEEEKIKDEGKVWNRKLAENLKQQPEKEVKSTELGE